MRALRFVEPMRLEVVELPDPAPRPGEVVLRVAACGICGSDLSCYKTGVFAGQVLGHEFAGVVEATGDGVEGWHAGDMAAVDPKSPCGECADCLAAAAHRCARGLTLGLGAARPGGFAELVVAPAASLHPLTPGVAVEDACLAEPLSVAIHGVNRVGPVEGLPVTVIGLGPIGLLTVAALRGRGVGPITCVEPVATRRSLALALGAERALPPGDEAREACAGAGVVIECSGRPEMLQEATNFAVPGGRVLLLGIPMEQVTVTPMAWVTREITIAGSVGSAADDFEAALRLLATRNEIASIISERVGLDQAWEAFERLLEPDVEGKVAVIPS